MDETLALALVGLLLFIMGMVAAWVVRLMITQEVKEQVPGEVEKQLDDRGILRRKQRP